MRPHSLTVVHRLKDDAGHGLPAGDRQWLADHGLFIDTCLRQLALLPDSAGCPPGISARAEFLHGRNAYNFLLQTITGLNSAIPGETNVQGQFRRAWERRRLAGDDNVVLMLRPFMNSLFRHSREVRRDHLQGIGGQSYGSLVRKLLEPGTDERILFVGGGDLAASILPLFTGNATAVWNHHPLDVARFAGSLYFAPDAAPAAARWASTMVLTTPADDENDARWAKLTGPQVRRIVHVGRRRAERGPWARPSMDARFLDLDDLFDLRNRQSGVRSLSIDLARKACTRLTAELYPPDRQTLLLRPLAQRA